MNISNALLITIFIGGLGLTITIENLTILQELTFWKKVKLLFLLNFPFLLALNLIWLY